MQINELYFNYVELMHDIAIFPLLSALTYFLFKMFQEKFGDWIYFGAYFFTATVMELQMTLYKGFNTFNLTFAFFCFLLFLFSVIATKKQSENKRNKERLERNKRI